MRGAGGTDGGVILFFVGLACAVAGGWLLTNQVTVTGGYWSLWGHNSFGLSLLPFLAGTAMLFFDRRQKLGWLLLVAGVVIILAGVLVNLRINFQPTSLFNTLMTLVLLFGGIGLILRLRLSLRRRWRGSSARSRCTDAAGHNRCCGRSRCRCRGAGSAGWSRCRTSGAGVRGGSCPDAS